MLKALRAAAALMVLATSATAYDAALGSKVVAYAINAGNTALTKRDPSPPAYASLHPDFGLKVSTH